MMSADNNPMQRCLNPITHSIHYIQQVHVVNIPTLEGLSSNAVRRAMGIARINQATELPLPSKLQEILSALCLNNFLINPDEVTARHHEERMFPAKCLLDNTRVWLQIANTDDTIPNDPAFVVQFQCSDIICLVFTWTTTLHDMVHEGSQFQEQQVWKILANIATTLAKLPLNATISPRYFHIKGSHMFYRAPTAPQTHPMTQVMNAPDMAFYEAPEVLMRAPASDRAHSWTFGCLAYEVTALEPAYFDRDKSGNLMAVMMGMTQGMKPPPLSDNYSHDLQDLIIHCLEQNASDRPSPQDIMDIVTQKTQQES